MNEESMCRRVLQTKTRCPKCHRSLTIKTLKYTHACGRTIEERIYEEERKAQAKHLPSQINQITRSSPGEPYVEMSFGKVHVLDIP